MNLLAGMCDSDLIPSGRGTRRQPIKPSPPLTTGLLVRTTVTANVTPADTRMHRAKLTVNLFQRLRQSLIAYRIQTI